MCSTAAITGKPGHYKSYFRCHRSGKYRKQPGAYKKILNPKKSCKMGVVCPAGMAAYTRPDLSVITTIWRTHYGHNNDLGHLPLTAKDRKELAEKISQGRTFDEILDEIRRDMDGTPSRLQLVTRKDLHSIVQSYNLKPMTSSTAPTKASSYLVGIGRGRFTENDVLDVAQWVERMEQLGHDSPVLLYRNGRSNAEGVAGGSTNVLDNDFILVVMSGGQQQLLRHFGPELVCLDVMNRSAPNEFSLTTLLVTDENSHAIPVAYCFSAEVDESTMSSFLDALHLRVGTICSQTFVSNAMPLCYEAWLATMASPAGSLLTCLWHKDHSWRKKISDMVIGGDEVTDRTYRALHLLLRQNEKKGASAELLLARNTSFVEKLVADPRTRGFGQHFEVTYARIVKSWASMSAHRGAKTEYTRLEAYHKILKHIYSGKRRFDNLDACLSALICKSRDKVFERLAKLSKDDTEARALMMLQLHRRGVAIPFTDLGVVEEGREWRVRVLDVAYAVFANGGPCDCLAREFCEACRANLCPHVYSCTCGDGGESLQVCEHVHAVVSRWGEDCSVSSLDITAAS